MRIACCHLESYLDFSFSAFYNKSILSSAAVSRTDSELENKVCIIILDHDDNDDDNEGDIFVNLHFFQG